MGSIFRIGGKILRLQDCLSAFTATETLMGDNQYECESCGKKRDGQKTLRIKTLPEVRITREIRLSENSKFESWLSSVIIDGFFPLIFLCGRHFA